jgi:hypothetical protein
MDGTAAAGPAPPTAAEDPVSRYTWSATANVVIWPPTDDTTDPTKSRRKAGERRSAAAAQPGTVAAQRRTMTARRCPARDGQRGCVRFTGLPSGSAMCSTR